MLGPSTITDTPVSIAEEPAVQPTGATALCGTVPWR